MRRCGLIISEGALSSLYHSFVDQELVSTLSSLRQCNRNVDMSHICVICACCCCCCCCCCGFSCIHVFLCEQMDIDLIHHEPKCYTMLHKHEIVYVRTRGTYKAKERRMQHTLTVMCHPDDACSHQVHACVPGVQQSTQPVSRAAVPFSRGRQEHLVLAHQRTRADPFLHEYFPS